MAPWPVEKSDSAAFDASKPTAEQPWAPPSPFQAPPPFSVSSQPASPDSPRDTVHADKSIFRPRLMARLFDGFTWFVILVLAAIVSEALNLTDLESDRFLSLTVFCGAVVLEWISRGASLGKRIFRLRVVEDSGERMGWIASAVRVAPLALSLVFVPLLFFDPAAEGDLSAYGIVGLLSIFLGLGLAIAGFFMAMRSGAQRTPWDAIARTRVTKL